MNKRLIIFCICALNSLMSYAQIDEVNNKDTTVTTIHQMLQEQKSDTSYRKVHISDSILKAFLDTEPLFDQLFGNNDSVNLPKVSIATLNEFVVEIEFYSGGLFNSSNAGYHFIGESLVRLTRSEHYYIQPSAMSDCSGWANASFVKYYQNNLAIKCVESKDRCAPFGLSCIYADSISRVKDLIEFAHRIVAFMTSE
ncbi:MAG: hypothetical protein HWE22_19815 [Flavobacteriales bacterium]|nr:hypothetical protein [Flavobacteriales bacterium]